MFALNKKRAYSQKKRLFVFKKEEEDDMDQPVIVFKPYPFEVGQKIYIDGSRRKGDWEVMDVTDNKVTLKCPLSKKELTWDRFCYFVEEKTTKWPSE